VPSRTSAARNQPLGAPPPPPPEPEEAPEDELEELELLLALAMVIVTVPLAVDTVVVLEAVSATVDEPSVVGVPEMTPVVVLTLSPAGNPVAV
jgi:hypothetical protein